MNECRIILVGQQCVVLTSKPTFDLLSYAYSPKLDGAAVSLLYVGGELQQALTRGDGKIGKDVTNKVKHLVPNTIGLTDTAWILQITGEIVAPASIPNARNYAAGALSLKDSSEFQERDLYFIAHGVAPFITNNYATDISKDIEYHIHALNWLKKNESYDPYALVNLRPTTPLRDPDIIDDAIKLFLENQSVIF